MKTTTKSSSVTYAEVVGKDLKPNDVIDRFKFGQSGSWQDLLPKGEWTITSVTVDMVYGKPPSGQGFQAIGPPGYIYRRKPQDNELGPVGL